MLVRIPVAASIESEPDSSVVDVVASFKLSKYAAGSSSARVSSLMTSSIC